MKSTRTVFWVAIVCAAVLFGVRVYTNTAHASFATRVGHPPVPEPTPTNAPAAKADVKSAGGLTTVTFDTKSGNVRIHLPDDMRAGDTISGTVVAEPKGETEEERKKNLSELGGYAITLDPQSSTATASKGVVNLPVAASNHFAVSLPTTGSDGGRIRLRLAQTKQDGQLIVGVDEVKLSVRMDDAQVDPSVSTSMRTPGFRLPTIGQQGRLIEIFGPFDGNASNTTLRFGPSTSTMQDFEKGTENVSGGFGLIKPLAESPRKIVFQGPENFSGPVQLFVSDGGQTAIGPHNNLGIRLTAPKTNLMRDEKTTVTIEVRGLEGIKKDVPLQLDSKGVITMEGGNFQNLRIKPNEVKADGTYTTTRGITGQQAGGFTVTATVIVTRFDFRLQDDTDPNRIFHFNSFTGDYVFACGGGSCRSGGSTGGTQTGGTPGKPGGATQPGGTDQPGGTLPGGTGPPPIVPPPPVTLTGTGKPAMKGCIITLSHNAPDRRVFARLDACTKTGDASVQTNSPKADIKITDKNTADNTAPSPPPK